MTPKQRRQKELSWAIARIKSAYAVSYLCWNEKLLTLCQVGRLQKLLVRAELKACHKLKNIK